MVGQLLEEEKEFGDLLVTATTSPKGIRIYVIIVISKIN
jgi:hypothetical protein